jgi:hypothetical protein
LKAPSRERERCLVGSRVELVRKKTVGGFRLSRSCLDGSMLYMMVSREPLFDPSGCYRLPRNRQECDRYDAVRPRILPEAPDAFMTCFNRVSEKSELIDGCLRQVQGGFNDIDTALSHKRLAPAIRRAQIGSD